MATLSGTPARTRLRTAPAEIVRYVNGLDLLDSDLAVFPGVYPKRKAIDMLHHDELDEPFKFTIQINGKTHKWGRMMTIGDYPPGFTQEDVDNAAQP